MISESFDIAWVRAQFPMMHADSGTPPIFFDNPGGTQTPLSVIEAVSDYYRYRNANVGGAFETSRRTDQVLSACRQAAADYVRELLLRQGRYRAQWEQFAERVRPGRINHLAVAEVLAQHLWNSPRESGDADVLPRQLKDTVGRALSGRLLSRATLALFIEAFGLSGQEEDRLWRLWGGSGRISVLSGPRAMAPGHAAEVVTALGPRKHQTLSLHDHHQVGRHGLPTRTRTLQVIESIVE